MLTQERGRPLVNPNNQVQRRRLSPQREAFMEFFEKYYDLSKGESNLKEMAQKLANNYLSAQANPKYQTEHQMKPPRFSAMKRTDDAIKAAKEKFEARKSKLLAEQPKIPKRQYQRSVPRCISSKLKQAPQSAIPFPKIQLQTQVQTQIQQLTTPTQLYYYQIGDGNNEVLIKQLMEKRINWVQAKESTKHVHFRWQETEKGFEYRTLVANRGLEFQLLNHFEFHSELSNKFLFAANIKDYCERKQMNYQDFVPTIFPIDQTKAGPQNPKYQLQQFLQFYRANAYTNQIEIDKILSKNNVKINGTDKAYTQYQTLFGPEYLWIFKPSNMNQGRGIHIITNLQQVFDLIQRYLNGYKEQLFEVKRNEQNEVIKKITYFNTLNTEQFVVQKYIEKPLLIKGRKFDVRVYVLLTSSMHLYFYKEGQLRLATEEFSLKEINNFIHLTNNAVQYNHENYGKSEEGNQFSFDQASDYFKMDFRQEVIRKLQEISLFVFTAVKHKLNKYKRKYCFEMFGLDFILDEKFKPWLIEVNSNPSIEVTSKLLAQLFPRLLDDTFKLTLDQIFQSPQTDTRFPFGNYDDNQNLWESLGQL